MEQSTPNPYQAPGENQAEGLSSVSKNPRAPLFYFPASDPPPESRRPRTAVLVACSTVVTLLLTPAMPFYLPGWSILFGLSLGVVSWIVAAYQKHFVLHVYSLASVGSALFASIVTIGGPPFIYNVAMELTCCCLASSALGAYTVARLLGWFGGNGKRSPTSGN